MSDKARLRIAATVTALFLAAISAAGVSAHGDRLAAPVVTTSSRSPIAQHAHPNPIFTSKEREHD